VGRVDEHEHRAIVEDLVAFLDGSTATYVKRLERAMKAAADELDYERAARLRDDVAALNRAMEANAVVLGDATDADVIALAEDELEVAVQVFHVRGGRIRGQRGWIADKAADASAGDLVERFVLQLYGEGGEAVPREVLVPDLPADQEEADALRQLLAEVREARVDLRVPARGDKRSLMETVGRNAAESLRTHKTKRASDLTTRSRALEELQAALDLEAAPLRIECYDVSNLQASDVVASMVVFEDGLPRKSEYRRFAVRGDDGTDDVASIREVLRRRFRRLGRADGDDERIGLAVELTSGETTADTNGKPGKFAYTPGLVVVDGGKPQVNAAREAMDETGVTDIPVIGLAKRLEEVWVPELDEPVILPRTSEALYLLQRARDEAHRFAITYHRHKRSVSMLDSLLDVVPGLGPARRRALMARFGSLKKLRTATAADVADVPGIGMQTAEAIVAAVAADRPAPAVNMATGEILDADITPPGDAGDDHRAD
jgi:excinuclease ABC subunit C